MKLELNKVYRARNGTEWKIFCIQADTYLPNGFIYPIFATNKKQNIYECFNEDGYIRGMHDRHSLDLIELIGNDFTEESTEE